MIKRWTSLFLENLGGYHMTLQNRNILTQMLPHHISSAKIFPLQEWVSQNSPLCKSNLGCYNNQTKKRIFDGKIKGKLCKTRQKKSQLPLFVSNLIQDRTLVTFLNRGTTNSWFMNSLRCSRIQISVKRKPSIILLTFITLLYIFRNL